MNVYKVVWGDSHPSNGPHLVAPVLPFPQQVTSYGSQCAHGPLPPPGGLDSAFLPRLLLLGPRAGSSILRVRATFWTCPAGPGPGWGGLTELFVSLVFCPRIFFRGMF